jgi:2,4-dienoyl-CoA reductase-like NADH-dependent reductase (Old Yellow Enzyme family)
VLNSDYNLARAQAALDAGAADAISFGRPFISNPDLVERLASGLPLAPDDQASWYSQGAEGYISYPRFEAAASEGARGLNRAAETSPASIAHGR